MGGDWIGIFELESENDQYLGWQYTDGFQYNYYDPIDSGYIFFSPISLPVGEYEVRLFYNNSYDVEVSYPFTITDSCIEIPYSDFDDTFRVMTFNTWYSAQYGYGGLDRVAEIIANLDIDIIGFQETDPSSILEIQFLLTNFFEGYEELYATPSESNISIISKFPIIDIYDYNLYGIGASIIISDYDTLKYISSHLSAYPYGPYDLYEGYSIDEVLENEMSYRYQENLDIYNQIIVNPSNLPNIPVIYVGDHNTPSTLDWTSENTDQNFSYELNWPVSEFLLENNFYDSYREVNPSLIDNPGLTWSPGYPKNTFDSWDVHDRIDMIYYKNGIRNNLYPLSSYVYDCDPWPSDHRAVVTEFSMCNNSSTGDTNSDSSIDVLDVVILINEILYSSDSYCKQLFGDIDINGELNVLDVIQLISIILN